MQLVFDAIMGQVREYMNSLFSALNVMMNDLQVKKKQNLRSPQVVTKTEGKERIKICDRNK